MTIVKLYHACSSSSADPSSGATSDPNTHSPVHECNQRFSIRETSYAFYREHNVHSRLPPFLIKDSSPMACSSMLSMHSSVPNERICESDRYNENNTKEMLDDVVVFDQTSTAHSIPEKVSASPNKNQNQNTWNSVSKQRKRIGCISLPMLHCVFGENEAKEEVPESYLPNELLRVQNDRHSRCILS